MIYRDSVIFEPFGQFGQRLGQQLRYMLGFGQKGYRKRIVMFADAHNKTVEYLRVEVNVYALAAVGAFGVVNLLHDFSRQLLDLDCTRRN
jgi:hypothetical protein